MPLRLEAKKKFSTRSDRVKCVDIHPTEPWILASLYNGHVYIWNYTNQNLVKSFEVSTDLPVRTAKFVARKQWVITGSDDMYIRVFNYNTMEKFKSFEAHSDYIRCIAVHPTHPYILSSSDDRLIKLWDWDKGWVNTQVFEDHTHYVMSIAINPKDPNIFATASLDRTIKVWGLGSASPYFTLEGHEKGVNCVEYFFGGDKPYLVSGADDKLVKVWDYQNKTCVQTLEGHSHNVSVICFHPELPIIISGSEDGSVRIWHANTYRLEKTLNYGMERVWAMAYLKGSNFLALGYDEGTVLLKLGREEPAVSMEQGGKIIWARHNEILTANIKSAIEGAQVPDGERLPLSAKELGNCEVYPQKLQHNHNGRFVVVCGDGEYIIYTSLAWRNKSFGAALDFVWGPETGQYAVRESAAKIKVFKNFKETKAFKPGYAAEGIFGGPLFSVRTNSFVCFHDWEDCNVIRRIDVCPKGVYWSDDSEHVAITTDQSFYILRYNKDAVTAALESGNAIDDDGIEDAFEVLHEIAERVRTATWVGDCFIYTNKNNRLNYCVGGETVTISHLDRHMYLLGYIPQNNRIYLTDKSMTVVSYTLHTSIIAYQTAILHKDYEAAAKILPKIPEDQLTRIAQFLESQGLKEQALEVTQDLDHKFELAIQLGKLDAAHEILQKSESEQKWKQLADLAMSSAKFDLAEKSLASAEDLGGLLLLYTSTGNAEGLEKLALLATEKGRNNIAFVSLFLLKRLEDCLELLCNTGRVPEAAFFARTYLPSHVSRIVALWRTDLSQVSTKAAEALADPMEYGNLFPDLQLALQAEQAFSFERQSLFSAGDYIEHKDDLFRNLLEAPITAATPSPIHAPTPAPTPAAPSSPLPSFSSPSSPAVSSPAISSPAVSSPAISSPATSSPVPLRTASPLPATSSPVPERKVSTPTPVQEDEEAEEENEEPIDEDEDA